MSRYTKQPIAPPGDGSKFTGAALAEHVNEFTSAALSGHYHEDRPQGAARGLVWSKKNGDDIEIVMFDGANDIHPLITRVAAGDPLPTSDIGPIWHDDFQTLMEWSDAAYRPRGVKHYRADENMPSQDIGPIQKRGFSRMHDWDGSEYRELGVTRINQTSSVAFVDVDIPADARSARLVVHDFYPGTSGGFLILQLGTAGAGGAFYSGASDYWHSYIQQVAGATANGNNFQASGMQITLTSDTGSSSRNASEFTLTGLNQDGAVSHLLGVRKGVNATPTHQLTVLGIELSVKANINALRCMTSSGATARLIADIHWG